MTRIPFRQVDAFADAPFSGNPAAVMLLGEWLPDAQLQAIGQENNLAETAFLVPCADAEVADFELRWFTPAVEVALCGHATLASGHVILGSAAGMDIVRFATRRSGVLTVARADGGGLRMALPALPATDAPGAADRAAITAALGAVPAETWLRGRDHVVAVYEHASEVRALQPDFRALAKLLTGDVLFIATAIGIGDASGAQVVSRVFVPGAGIDEDSVTGSAHAVIAPYWADRLGRADFTAYQASARGGHMGCRLEGDRVVLTGRCVTTIEGEFIL
ncbi:PhzF family phenazine biosynthesis protein [Polymorphobacter fuscus]|uniref:PhzF family phenazine biosynthesis isomerase n=1 Tax=Sandarakinorhabdus fusca TaxID=1439888 RepID=A0A7C9GTN2_9SPHN|nr:PhzF family phenazine biosynthesis protein [Polymorphobacter fuscus]KAB7648910.1 PhzF family phenazine biosynthesis protein [Polymorphobacter fuscus]MQT16498.1 PhzF family phenazine biosynthesis isomerase [Polymorphobacter fuscus]NJC07212.1 PhzF family phenazine biosynthesis protein [Polymorphobacter fuscus]